LPPSAREGDHKWWWELARLTILLSFKIKKLLLRILLPSFSPENATSLSEGGYKVAKRQETKRILS
jgi:hypothetical protein